MTSLYGFLVMAGSIHHLYYLEPFIKATVSKEYCHLYTQKDENTVLQANFPKLLMSDYYFRSKEIIDCFKKYAFIIYSSFYPDYENNIRPHLNKSTVSVYTNHGCLQKFANDLNYVMSLFWADVMICSGPKDLDLIQHYDIASLEGCDRSKPILTHCGDRDLLIIQGGNIRTNAYLRMRSDKASITEGLQNYHPNRKTILYMPTFSNNVDLSRDDYCSIPLFVDFIKALKCPESYNFIVKLHPNLSYEARLLSCLDVAISRHQLNVHADIFGADYFRYMDIADIMLTDRTSAAFDFLYFDKPMLFLDHLKECKSSIDFDDIVNSYWLFQCGDVITPNNVIKSQQFLENAFSQDTYPRIRKKCREYSFDDSLSVKEILGAMHLHPKRN